jgi:hypothetical protein
MARARHIPKPPHPDNPNHHQHGHPHGVNIPPHTLFHETVRQRMQAEEAYTSTWRTLWTKKNKPYKPRAWPQHGDPFFVEDAF